MRIPTLQLPLQLRKQLAEGHPWVYRDNLAPGLRFGDGAWVRLDCGDWSGWGLWDDQSPIAVRVFSRAGVPDEAWVADRVREAWELRAPLRQTATTAYRVLFGEGDGLPGIVADLYGPFAVVAAYAGSVRKLVAPVVDALRRTIQLEGVLERLPRDERAGAIKTRPLWGAAPPRDLVVEEHGLRFRADLHGGQKTGLFLDQRENRKYLEPLCFGRRVLNCFSYTGAFSVYAAWGGAAEIISCDVAPSAAEDARGNFALNGFNPNDYEFVAADCFALLERYAAQGRRFDLVILDPPSFATSRRQLYAALRAYTRLNRLALTCIEPGGLLASASCTSQVSSEQFRAMLSDAARQAERRLQIVHDAGQPLDHPVPAHFPEGRYLNFVVARVMTLA